MPCCSRLFPLQHLPSGVCSPGILTCARVVSVCAFTQLNMTFQRTRAYRGKKREEEGSVCTPTCLHTSQRLWESQNAEPEGCCASDVSIVYSVVPVHVGDCCTLMPQSSLVLLTLTAVDSRLLSRRAARPREGRKRCGGGGKDRRRPKEKIIDYTFSPYICSHSTFFSFLGSALILYPQTSAPMGHQLSDSQRRVPPLFLSALLSLFGIWDTHRFAPRESFGNPR